MWNRPVGRALVFALRAWLVLMLLQLLLLLLASDLVSAILANVSVPDPGVDAIYWGLAVSMLGSARPVGLALGLPFGVAFSPGASVVGVQLLQLAVNAVMIAGGTAVLVLSYARPRWRWLRHGLHTVQARIVGVLALSIGLASQLQLPWGLGGGDMALSMVATKVLRIDSQAYEAALGWEPAVSGAINLALALATALLAAGISVLILRFAGGRRAFGRFRLAAGRYDSWRAAAALGMVVVALVPIQGRAVLPESQYLVGAGQAATESAERAVEAANASGQQAQTPNGPAKPVDRTWKTPAVVTIQDEDGKFVYLVNGKREFVRGIGYNPVDQGKTGEERAARFNRDFAEMAGLGVNTITGWDDSEFDDVLMDAAATHHIGVILPFGLPRNANYEDPDVRERLLRAITERVMHFKDDPALRMWGLGNEILHDMSVLRYRPAVQTAFASFEIEAADAVHRIDPNHPVIYRDAEDVYVKPIATALKSSNISRPWFVYGMNFFTTRLDDALNKGAAKTLNQPLLISEFGPVGVRPSDRPAGYAKLWSIIKSHSDSLLGGCAYVWSTNGPEPLDRTFGLTNDAGQPVDGSTSALAQLYTTDEAKELASEGSSSS